MERKLKYPHLRRPAEKVHFTGLAKEVMKRTGYREQDIKEVIRVAIDVIIEHLMLKRAVVLPKLGMLFPYIQLPKKVNALTGKRGESAPMKSPAKWILRFRPGKHISDELQTISPTEEEIDNLYVD